MLEYPCFRIAKSEIRNGDQRIKRFILEREPIGNTVTKNDVKEEFRMKLLDTTGENPSLREIVRGDTGIDMCRHVGAVMLLSEKVPVPGLNDVMCILENPARELLRSRTVRIISPLPSSDCVIVNSLQTVFGDCFQSFQFKPTPFDRVFDWPDRIVLRDVPPRVFAVLEPQQNHVFALHASYRETARRRCQQHAQPRQGQWTTF